MNAPPVIQVISIVLNCLEEHSRIRRNQKSDNVDADKNDKEEDIDQSIASDIRIFNQTHNFAQLIAHLKPNLNQTPLSEQYRFDNYYYEKGGCVFSSNGKNLPTHYELIRIANWSNQCFNLRDLATNSSHINPAPYFNAHHCRWSFGLASKDPWNELIQSVHINPELALTVLG
ncbi:uncharacterized protein MELLADRAFT_110485 [Melampsora larici-populina 98AG31]|uniref:Uncharacterized protein n=1 Tax=Melampsora larici-populina (strain 98AG31 / pathotype 3-4-7) TaxID=747676 RepID=F4RZY9_MELLP|nr:uncharacterized protein MELLADRAFT_110485 [Melampsora larici-populina 98AG31]EGG02104.1 hypothetical protein MELLADRAFT_110485 [Melampsora larici-populina 98AG31]